MAPRNRRLNIDECRELPAHAIAKKLSGEPGMSCLLSWPNGKECKLACTLDPEARSIRLEGKVKHTSLGNQELSQTLDLVATTPRCGGVRWWYTCPGCGKRRASLFLPPTASRFECRTCCGLAYWSSQTSGTTADDEEWEAARNSSRARKLGTWVARSEMRRARRRWPTVKSEQPAT